MTVEQALLLGVSLAAIYYVAWIAFALHREKTIPPGLGRTLGDGGSTGDRDGRVNAGEEREARSRAVRAEDCVEPIDGGGPMDRLNMQGGEPEASISRGGGRGGPPTEGGGFNLVRYFAQVLIFILGFWAIPRAIAAFLVAGGSFWAEPGNPFQSNWSSRDSSMSLAIIVVLGFLEFRRSRNRSAGRVDNESRVGATHDAGQPDEGAGGVVEIPSPGAGIATRPAAPGEGRAGDGDARQMHADADMLREAEELLGPEEVARIKARAEETKRRAAAEAQAAAEKAAAEARDAAAKLLFDNYLRESGGDPADDAK